MTMESDNQFFNACDVVIAGSITKEQFQQLDALQAIEGLGAVRITIEPFCIHAYYVAARSVNVWGEWVGALKALYPNHHVTISRTISGDCRACVGKHYLGRFSRIKNKASIIIWRGMV